MICRTDTQHVTHAYVFTHQAYFLVADDIMDGSITRRGQPCWYKKDNIGMMAVNDALILESCIYELLDKHLKGDPYYHDAVDAFHKVGAYKWFRVCTV